MKKYSILLSLFALIAVSCNKEETPKAVSDVPQEIILNVNGAGIEADVQTRVTAVSSIPTSLYFAGTKGSGSSQTSKWSSTSKSVSSNSISTGYYQTNPATAYNYFLSNISMSSSASGCTITADGSSTDAVAGVTKASSSVNPSVTLNHIFARTGSVSLTSEDSSYSISGASITIQSTSGTGYKGTYNIYSGTWSNVTALSATSLTSSSDLYLVPGTYTISGSCTLSKGDYSKSISGSTTVTLTAGKINNIGIKFKGGDAQQIVVSVTLNSWGTTSVSGTIGG